MESSFDWYNLGAIKLDHTDSFSNNNMTMDVVIINTFFSENSAIENGGAIYQMGNVNLTIENSSFIRNRAQIGGLLLIDCEYFEECNASITNTSIEENFAEIAPTIMSKSKFVTIINSNLINNRDSTGFAMNRISSYPLKILCLGDIISQNGEEEDVIRRLIKENISEKLWEQPQVITSGKEFNTSLIIIDIQLNYLVFDDSSRATINPDVNNTIHEFPQADSSTENLVIERAQATSSKGVFRFKNVKIINRPNTTITLRITIALQDLFFKSSPPVSDFNSEIYDGRVNLVAQLKLFVRPCLRGELLIPDYTCYFCSEGK
jgi:predicted outer membrane repeat protein